MSEKDNEEKSEFSADLQLEADELLTKISGRVKPVDILIVDDVYANVFLVENMLNDRYSVRGVANAAEMWQYLKVKAPRLILLDLMMSVESGFDVLVKLKADAVLRKIPVIVVSAKDSKSDVIRVLALGAVDYIVKPVDEHSLMMKVRKALGEKEEGPELKLEG